MTIRREHFTPAEKPKRIEDMIRDRDELRVTRWQDRPEDAVTTEPSTGPMKPLVDVANLVEEAREKLLEAAKIADAANMPAIHMPVTAVRLEVER